MPDPRLIRRPRSGQRALFQMTAGGDELIPLRTGKPAALSGKPRLQEMGDGKVDIVAAKQRMLAHRDTPYIRVRRLLVQANFKNAEIRRAAADIDDQHVSQPGIAVVVPLP
jgi:hypothetical protein